jgi:hypothetical protein
MVESLVAGTFFVGNEFWEVVPPKNVELREWAPYVEVVIYLSSHIVPTL